MDGYIDLGSQCTLIRYSDASRLGITWDRNPSGDLPVLRGLGGNTVIPLGAARVEIKIQEIVENIEIFIVEDSVIKYPVIIGHNFTERPGIVLIKTDDSLEFTRKRPLKLNLILQKDVLIPSQHTMAVPVITGDHYSGLAYVTGSVRGKPGYEMHLLAGEYSFTSGQGGILVQNVSVNSVVLSKGNLLTRALTVDKFF